MVKGVLKRFRLGLAVVAAALMCVEPTALAMSPHDQQVLIQSLERSGMLSREIRLDELYRFLKPELSPNDQSNFEAMLKMYPSFMMPKLIVSRIPGGNGQQDLQIQFSRKHESGSIVISERNGIFARFAGVTLTEEDMQSEQRLDAKLDQAERNLDGRKPASEERIPQGVVYVPKKSSASSKVKNAPTLLSYQEFQTLSPQGQKQYVKMLRDLTGQMEKVQNARVKWANAKRANGKRKPASRSSKNDDALNENSLVPKEGLGKWTAFFQRWEPEASADDTDAQNLKLNKCIAGALANGIQNAEEKCRAHYASASAQSGERAPLTDPAKVAEFYHVKMPSADSYQSTYQHSIEKCIKGATSNGIQDAEDQCRTQNTPHDEKTILIHIIRAQNEELAAQAKSSTPPSKDALAAAGESQVAAIQQYNAAHQDDRITDEAKLEMNKSGSAQALVAAANQGTLPAAPQAGANRDANGGGGGGSPAAPKIRAGGTRRASVAADTSDVDESAGSDNSGPKGDQSSFYRASAPASAADAQRVDKEATRAFGDNASKSLVVGQTRCLVAGNISTYGTGDVCGGPGAAQPLPTCSMNGGGTGVKCNPQLYGEPPGNKTCVANSAHAYMDCASNSTPADLLAYLHKSGINGADEWNKSITSLHDTLRDQLEYCRDMGHGGEVDRSLADQKDSCGGLINRMGEIQNFECPLGAGGANSNAAQKIPSQYQSSFLANGSHCEGPPTPGLNCQRDNNNNVQTSSGQAIPPSVGAVNVCSGMEDAGPCAGYHRVADSPNTANLSTICGSGTKELCQNGTEAYYRCNCPDGQAEGYQGQNGSSTSWSCANNKPDAPDKEKPGFFSRAWTFLKKHAVEIGVFSLLIGSIFLFNHFQNQALTAQTNLLAPPVNGLATPVPSTGIGGSTTTTPTNFPTTYPSFGGQRNGMGQ